MLEFVMALIGAGIVLVLFGFIKLSLQNKTLIQIVFISFLLVFLTYLLYSLYSLVIAAAGFAFLMLLFTYIIGKQITPKNEQNEESFRPSSSSEVVDKVAKRPAKADVKVKEAVQPEINTNIDNDMPSEAVASEVATNVVETSEVESSTSSGAILQQDAIDELIRQATGEQTQNEEKAEVVEEKSILELEIEQENELNSSSDESDTVVAAQEPVVEEEQEEEEDLFSASDAPLSQEMIDRLFAEFEQNNDLDEIESESEIAGSLEVIEEVADKNVEMAEEATSEEVEVTEEVNQEEIFYQRPKRMLVEESDKKEESVEEPTLLSRRPSAIQEEPEIASSEEPESYDEDMTYGRQAQEDFWNELKGTKNEQTSNRSKLFDELEENIFEDQK